MILCKAALMCGSAGKPGGRCVCSNLPRISPGCPLDWRLSAVSVSGVTPPSRASASPSLARKPGFLATPRRGSMSKTGTPGRRSSCRRGKDKRPPEPGLSIATVISASRWLSVRSQLMRHVRIVFQRICQLAAGMPSSSQSTAIGRGRTYAPSRSVTSPGPRPSRPAGPRRSPGPGTRRCRCG